MGNCIPVPKVPSEERQRFLNESRCDGGNEVDEVTLVSVPRKLRFCIDANQGKKFTLKAQVIHWCFSSVCEWCIENCHTERACAKLQWTVATNALLELLRVKRCRWHPEEAWWIWVRSGLTDFISTAKMYRRRPVSTWQCFYDCLCRLWAWH